MADAEIRGNRFTAEIVALVIAGAGVLALAYLFYSWDRDFLADATVTQAVVVDKDSRTSSSSSTSDENYSVSYRWTVESGHEYRGQPVDETWSGTDSWSGGEERWEALEPGVSTVEIAWRYTDEGRSTESRLHEYGFVGVPWPMVFLGLILFGVAAGRVIWRRRKTVAPPGS